MGQAAGKPPHFLFLRPGMRRSMLREVTRRLSSARLAAWYGQLRDALVAGIDLPQAILHCGGPPERDRVAMAQALRAGHSVDAVLEVAPAWLPFADRLLLSAGAASGKLPESCEALAREHRDLAENRLRLWLAALYPALVLHAAALLLPLAGAVELTPDGAPRFDGAGYLRNISLLLGGTWAGLVLLRALAGRFPGAAERVLRRFPLVGSYCRHRGLARFAAVLHALLEAGCRYAEAVGGAALAVNDTRLRPPCSPSCPGSKPARRWGR
jgi:type II secretory pathway component PulF